MDNLILDFEQAKAKHLLFKSRLRSILYDIPVDEAQVLSHHECSVGKWIYGHALQAYGHVPEMQELEMVHADIHITARKLVALHKEGKTAEAKKGLTEMELIADKLISLLTIIEQTIDSDPVKQPVYESLDFRREEYQELLMLNAELDKRIKQQIAENSEAVSKYDTVLAALHEGVIIQDANGVLQSANDSAVQLLGIKLDKLQGKTSMDADWGSIYDDGTPMPGEEHPPMLALRTGKSFLNQLMGVKKGDGSLIWVRVNSRPLINKDSGKVTGVVSSFFDVTDERKAEEALQESLADQQSLNEELAASNEEQTAINEELSFTNDELVKTQGKLQDMVVELAESDARFRVLIQQAPVSIFILKGREQTIEAMNDRMFAMLGKTADIIGKTYIEALPEFEGQPFFKLIDDVFTSGNPYYGNEVLAKIEREGVIHDGYYNFIYQPVKDERGITNSVMCVSIDVTEQVNARKVVERAEESLRMAIDAAELASFNIDTADRIFYASPRLKEFFGFAPHEDVPYEAAMNQIHPDYRQAVANMVETAITHGIRYDMEHPVIGHNDSKIRWVRGIGEVQHDANGKSIFTGVLHEITEKKLDEIRKNDFIGMVSHELKTPLTSLTAIIQVLNAKLKNSENEFIASALDKAAVQVKKMSTMINGFLNISRLESGKLLIHKEPFDIEALLVETIHEVALTVSSHEIVFMRDEPLMVNADRDKIGSVISNLLSNAVKYSPKGKIIEVTCSHRHNEALISIRDSGMGIDARDAEKLFDRYYRVENKNTAHISGFGIGLYLSSEIIKQHGGKIWVESEPGDGATFLFTVPV